MRKLFSKLFQSFSIFLKNQVSQVLADAVVKNYKYQPALLYQYHPMKFYASLYNKIVSPAAGCVCKLYSLPAAKIVYLIDINDAPFV